MDRDDNLLPETGRLARTIAILWPSFLVAALAELAIFALFDPGALRLPWGQPVTRAAAYTIGFFAFWTLGALSSALTTFLAPGGERAALPEQQGR